MTMDYSPSSEREIWPFLKVAISLKLKRPRPPNLVCMHFTSVYSCINFLSQFRLIKFFDDYGLNFGHFEGKQKGGKSLKAERPRPPKSMYMHVTSMPTCMNFLGQFQFFKFFDDHGL